MGLALLLSAPSSGLLFQSLQIEKQNLLPEHLEGRVVLVILH